jgi:hypothetical protein
MAQYKKGDHVVVRKNVLTGTTSDELTRVFLITGPGPGSSTLVMGHLVRQGPGATQAIDTEGDIERAADEREVYHASTTGRA